jgi:shikimate kinase
VDLLGPPAAGKSTLCKAIFDTLHEDSMNGWIDLSEAKQRAIRHAFSKAIPKPTARTRVFELIRAIKNFLTAQDGNLEAIPYFSSNFDYLRERMMESFATSHHCFLEALAEQWHDPDTPLPPKFERFHLVRQWIKELLFITSFVGDTKVIADNARLTKGMAELLSNPRFQNAQKIVSEYCQSPMAPTGIIHLAASVETVNQRFKQRHKESGRLNPGHDSRSQTEIATYTARKNSVNEHAIGFFESQGIAVLNLTAESELRMNVSQVISFLKGLPQKKSINGQA